MFTHVVLLEPKPEVAADDIAVALEHVKNLQGAIPGIIAIQTGQNLSASHNSYTYGFVMSFADAAAFQAYLAHPAHTAVSAELQRLCQQIIDFDSDHQPKTNGPNLLHALKTAYQAFVDGWSKAGKTADTTTEYV